MPQTITMQPTKLQVSHTLQLTYVPNFVGQLLTVQANCHHAAFPTPQDGSKVIGLRLQQGHHTDAPPGIDLP